MLKVNLNDDRMDENGNGNEGPVDKSSKKESEELNFGVDEKKEDSPIEKVSEDVLFSEEDLIISEEENPREEILSDDEDKTELIEITEQETINASEGVTGENTENVLKEGDNEETVFIDSADDKPRASEDDELEKAKERLAQLASAERETEPETATSSEEETVYEGDDEYYEGENSTSSGKMKWIIIGVLLILLLGALFYFFNPFGGGEEEIAEQKPKETPEMIKARENQAKTVTLIKNIRENLLHQVTPVTEFYGQLNKNMKLSMILIYGNEITIETFSTDRTPLAKFRQNLKKAEIFDRYKQGQVISLRPDRDVLATFSASPFGGNATVDSGAVFSDPASIKDNIVKLGASNGVKVSLIGDVGTFRGEGELKKARLSYRVSGKEDKIISFIGQLAASGMTITIDKLSVASVSKNNVKKRNMAGRLDIYVYAPGF